MGYNPIWYDETGEYAYFRNDSGILYRRKMDSVHYKYSPWEVVSESQNTEYK